MMSFKLSLRNSFFLFCMFVLLQAMIQMPAEVQRELCSHCQLPESPIIMLEQLLMNEKVFVIVYFPFSGIFVIIDEAELL